MDWAARRRFLILLIVGAVVVAFLTVLAVVTFYESPSCADNKQNQGEMGVDCGGPCAYLCTAELLPPTVLYTKALQNREGRVDVIAEVENKNPGAAAKNVPYRITLYGSDQAFIQDVVGVLDLPPSVRVPVFYPGIASGKQTVARAFLEIAPSSIAWFTLSADPRVLPSVSTPTLGGTEAMPRIEAVLSNAGITPFTNVRVIAAVQDSKGEVIAASSTLLPSVPSQGQATAIFTWNEPFTSVPAQITVTPLVALP